MKNKSTILILTILVAISCLYQLSFTLISRNIYQEATQAATDKSGLINYTKRQKYLDSIWTKPVYNFFGIQYTYKDIKSKELALGLDLQGGMHVTLEVSPVEILKVLAGNSKDPNFLKSIEQAKAMQAKSQKTFVDLFAEAFQKNSPGVKLASIFTNTANKGKIDYNTSDAEVLKVIKKEVEDAVDRSFNILRTRIDKFGVTNPNIQKLQGTGRILLELPGVDNPERVRKLISGIAKLEFWEVWETQEIAPYLEQFNTYLVAMEKNEKSTKTKTQQKEIKSDDLTAQSTDKQDELGVTKKEEKKEAKKEEKKETKKEEKNKKDTSKTAEAKNEKKTDSASAQNGKDTTDKIQQSSFFGSVLIPTPEGLAAKPQDTARINEILNRSEVKNIFPANLKFLWSVKPDEENGLLTLFAIKKARGGKAPLEGDVIIDARQDFDQKSRPEVTMQMNAIGAKNWKKLTGSNVGKRIAIVLDDNVYSAPRVQNEIPNGNSSISGSFTIEEAKDLANILKAGKLPAPTRIVEEAIIGPSLGKESINQGLISMVIGMSAVVLFMFAYYSGSGGIANIALVLNIFFIFGVLAQFSAVLTLPGIAGIALTIGMSVDANVLIFERIKEELGVKSLTAAIKVGFEKAYSSIIDANVTTFLIGGILYNFGSGPIKGFAVTLMIGIVCSLFSAIFITRLIIEALTRNENRKISFDTFLSKRLFKNAHFNFTNMRRFAYIGSAVFIVGGIILIAVQGGLNLGVDFKGGRSYVVKFSEPVLASDARNAITKTIPGSVEVKTFGGNDQLKITTSHLIDDESETADAKVEDLLKKGLAPFQSKKPEIISSSKVGGTIADDIKNTSQIAILFSLIVIFVYILVRFRKWQFGLGAVAALFHDVLFVLSGIAIARLFGISFEIDQVFIAAILTVIGYSINDTVVVFDRIREFAGEITRNEFKQKMNDAINQTLSRTVVTSGTTLIVVLILLLFGGEVLRGFSFSLFVGIIVGTYSSIFIASPIVLDFVRKSQQISSPQGKAKS